MINRRNPCKANSLIETPKDIFRRGFTLIELSIVLVIIGLIVGGILVGQDLIAAAAIRAQITQIERYNTAVNTFRGKYGYLPGDIPDPQASQFGFSARGQYAGEGDGDGIIMGLFANAPNSNAGGAQSMAGENAMFWEDLSTAKLIDQTFNTATSTAIQACLTDVTNTSKYYPQAKLGNNNFVFVVSDGYYPAGGPWVGSGVNYFNVSAPNLAISGQCSSGYGQIRFTGQTTFGISVNQAALIDTKIDDGLPQSGKVMAQTVIGWTLVWASSAPNGFSNGLHGIAGPAYTTMTPGTSTTCYDNGSGSGAMQYSTGQNNGAGLNCALSFKFQ